MPLLTCDCGTICVLSAEDFKKRAGQVWRCRKCGAKKVVPGKRRLAVDRKAASGNSSLPAVIRSSSYPVDLSVTEDDRQSPSSSSLTPIAMTFVALAIVALGEFCLLLFFESAKPAVAPFIRSAADHIRRDTPVSIDAGPAGEIIRGGTEINKRLGELEQAAEDQNPERRDDLLEK